MKMRKIFILSLIILLNGCSSKKHMEFKNIPIDGNLDKFVNELIKLGFSEPQIAKENQTKLKGEYIEKNCEIYVFGTVQSQTAYKVTVNLPQEVQDSIEKRFAKIQGLYSSKYGIGISKYQQFQNSERFLFNEPKRIRHLSPGDFSRYTTGSGVITLEVGDGRISITFLDKQNNEIWKREMREGKQKSINEKI
jgi:hypothetical protein